MELAREIQIGLLPKSTPNLRQFLTPNHGMRRALYENVLSFAGGAEQVDDLTALVIKRLK